MESDDYLNCNLDTLLLLLCLKVVKLLRSLQKYRNKTWRSSWLLKSQHKGAFHLGPELENEDRSGFVIFQIASKMDVSDNISF